MKRNGQTRSVGRKGRFTHGLYPAASAALLETDLRRLIKSPTLVADRLELQGGERVLEIGAGGGYYSQSVAQRLPKGILICQDIQLEMLERLTANFKNNNTRLPLTFCSDAEHIPLTSNSCDVVFMVTVLGEVHNAMNVLRESFRILELGGRLSIGEQRTDPDFISRGKLIEMACAAGFTLEKTYGWFWNYTANFVKASAN